MALANKTALITGGVKNLGAEIAILLAGESANLALHYNSEKTKPDAEKIVKELGDSHPKSKVKVYQGDLTTAAAVEGLFEDVLKDFGGIDIVVNTVGMVLKKPIVEISERNMTRCSAAFFILKESAKHVNQGGKIITIVTSLLAAFTGLYTSYAGSKSPVEHFTRGVSKELAPKMISVNAVGPGPMDTPFFYPQEGADAVAFHKSSAMGNRLTDVKDIAPIIKFLCTEGGWITGQTLFANGGYTTR